MKLIKFSTEFFFIILLTLSCSNVEQKNTNIEQKIQTEEKKIPADVSEIAETQADVTSTNEGELNTKDITQNRGLSQYERGGHFIKGGLIKDNPCFDCGEKSVRDFIWKNWTDKKRAYIRITYNGIDASSTSHIFIEPNEKGEWRIAWRIARQHTIPEYNNLVNDIPTIFKIERIENKPDKGEWALAFKDESGKILQTMPYSYIEQ